MPPGSTGGCDAPGTPSISIGTCTPCQWTVVDCGSRLVKCTMSAIATSSANQRPGKPAVVCPGVGPHTRRDLERRDARLERDFDDPRIRIDVDGLGELQIRVPPCGLEALCVGTQQQPCTMNESQCRQTFA